MRRELRAETVGGLLSDLGVLPRGSRTEVRSLSGGVANVVLSVTWDGGAVVVKQALPRLRVAADWAFDPARTRIERDCLAYLGQVLPPGAVPEVVAYEADDDVLVMSQAPPGGVVWKDELLAGRVDPAVAARVGEMLGTLHREAARDPAVQERFAEAWPLVQGRVDPYHRTVAAVHPDLAERIDREVQRLLETRTTLVLGDCSPKNVIAYRDRALLLDFEVAHWGDPAFDVAFLLTHMVLKARHRRADAAPLHASAVAFLEAYRQAAPEPAPADAAVIAELGCLLLSRIDGKSPAEYLTDDTDRSAVRAAARMLLVDGPRQLAAALSTAFELVTRPPERTA